MIDIDITKRYPGFTLDVRFQAGNGITGLLGASGSGKSQTLRAIAGLTRPDSGHIIVNGRRFFDTQKRINLSPQARRTGFLFQNYALFPNMSVRANIGAALKKGPERNACVEALIARYHLGAVADKKPAQLSGGQAQRCALARIMACPPEILLLDEPFSALDSGLRWQMQQELLFSLQDYAGSVLFVTHARDELCLLCHDCGVLENGKSVYFGPVSRLFSAPESRAELLLTGVKNITRFTRTDTQQVFCPDWGLRFKTAAPVRWPSGFVGIHAHAFYACQAETVNAFYPVLRRRLTAPFAWTFLFDAPGGAMLCWEVPKKSGAPAPAFADCLTVAPEDVLLVPE